MRTNDVVISMIDGTSVITVSSSMMFSEVDSPPGSAPPDVELEPTLPPPGPFCMLLDVADDSPGISREASSSTVIGLIGRPVVSLSKPNSDDGSDGSGDTGSAPGDDGASSSVGSGGPSGTAGSDVCPRADVAMRPMHEMTTKTMGRAPLAGNVDLSVPGTHRIMAAPRDCGASHEARGYPHRTR